MTRGRGVPRERLEEVAEHYHHFGGVSPINGQVRELIEALEPELLDHKINLPIYWGNRNWHPLLPEALAEMVRDGRHRALGLVMAGYSSYSSCRQYREDVARGQEVVGQDSPTVDKIRVFYNHPDFVAANADRVREALDRLPPDLRESARVTFTAHSIPESMASRCDYEQQLTEAARLVAEAVGIEPDRWSLVYQSRSGRPQDPWLGPDILNHVDTLASDGVKALIVQPIGFLSDHMEVLFDLDEEASERAKERSIVLERAGTVGTHPRFVAMLRELIAERLELTADRRAIGRYPPNHDVCPVGCCPAPLRPSTASRA